MQQSTYEAYSRSNSLGIPRLVWNPYSRDPSPAAYSEPINTN